MNLSEQLRPRNPAPSSPHARSRPFLHLIMQGWACLAKYKTSGLKYCSWNAARALSETLYFAMWLCFFPSSSSCSLLQQLPTEVGFYFNIAHQALAPEPPSGLSLDAIWSPSVVKGTQEYKHHHLLSYRNKTCINVAHSATVWCAGPTMLCLLLLFYCLVILW